MHAEELPADRRAELIYGIREHLDAARDAHPGMSVEAMRDVLDRLGDPAVVVAAALPPDSSRNGIRHESLRTEWAATLWMTVGSFVPVLGWLIGVRFALRSRIWTGRQKLTACLITPGGPLVALWLSVVLGSRTSSACGFTTSGALASLDAMPTSTTTTVRACSSPILAPWVAWIVIVTVVCASVVGPAVLMREARRNRRIHRARESAALS